MPVIGLLDTRSPDDFPEAHRAFRQGLKTAGFVEGENVAIENRWGQNQTSRLPELAAELVRRRVAVIATLGGETAAVAAKGETATIPIVFISGQDPVKQGLVVSIAVLLDPAAISQESIFLLGSWQRSVWGCCTSWCLEQFASLCSSTSPMCR